MAFDLDDEENEATRVANGASKESRDKNMDIEVGEYVRTKNGIIDMVERSSTDCCIWHCKNGMCIDEYNCIGTHLEDIVKHRKKLIDLVEVGDIVNSCIVVGFGYECVNGNKEKSILVEGKYTKVNFALLNWDIKTILTKEQMMANCYKVGGENE